ncbi:MAG: 50S ribosomal protein L29 [Clostridia bacterium]|nr:50S ribosomal protein L29 [Clostridia bacterium]
MKLNEIRKTTSSDLNKEIVELKQELFKLRFQLATNGLDNPMKIKNIKKDIAKIKTVIRARELGKEEEVK